VPDYRELPANPFTPAERFGRGVANFQRTYPTFGPTVDPPEPRAGERPEPKRGVGDVIRPLQVSPGPGGPLTVDPELVRLRKFNEERERDRAKWNRPFNFIGGLPELAREKAVTFLPTGIFEAAVATGGLAKKFAGFALGSLIYGPDLGTHEEGAIAQEGAAERVRRFRAGQDFARGALGALFLAQVIAAGGPAAEVVPVWEADP
jgi:hypothetical protein